MPVTRTRTRTRTLTRTRTRTPNQLEKEDTLLITKFVWLMQKKTTARAHPNPTWICPSPSHIPPNSVPLCGAARSCVALANVSP